MPKAKKSPLSQRVFLKFFRGIVWLDTFRHFHPVWFSLLASSLVFAAMVFVTGWLGIDRIPHPDWWFSKNPYLSPSALSRFAVSLMMSVILTQPIARQLLPMLFYVPQAISMKSLGLLYVITEESEQGIVVKKCVDEHDERQPVKVICISGRHLFREENMPNGERSPLHDLARQGKLEVILPKSSPENQTVSCRYATYDDTFRSSTGVDSLEGFISEINAGKRFLVRFNNQVHEHDILCMWRVMIFTSHSIVQCYFPNATRGHSFRAPMFVYCAPGDGVGDECYYNLHVKMFELVKSGCTPFKG